MHVSAVKSLLSALCQLLHQCISGTSSSSGPTTSQKIGNISFSVERMISILVNNVHRVEPFWDEVISHFLELADNPIPNLKNMALDALDQSIFAVLGSDRFRDYKQFKSHETSQEMEANLDKLRSFEYSVISPLKVLYFATQSVDARVGSLQILLHVLECMHETRVAFPVQVLQFKVQGSVQLSLCFRAYVHGIKPMRM